VSSGEESPETRRNKLKTKIARIVIKKENETTKRKENE